MFGFCVSEDRDRYEVDEAKMAAVWFVFGLVSEGRSIAAVARALDEQGFPPPHSAETRDEPRWARLTVRQIVSDDCYKPHDHAEISAFVSPEVAASLDPSSHHGVWWYNRREVVKTRRGKKVRPKRRGEWIAVPVPDAGVPRETVERARCVVERNERFSDAGRREWELSGGLLRCGDCGNTLHPHTATQPKKGIVRYYYRCSTYRKRGRLLDDLQLRGWKAGEDMAGRAGAMLAPEVLEEDLKARPDPSAATRDPDRLRAVVARLGELESVGTTTWSWPPTGLCRGKICGRSSRLWTPRSGPCAPRSTPWPAPRAESVERARTPGWC